ERRRWWCALLHQGLRDGFQPEVQISIEVEDTLHDRGFRRVDVAHDTDPQWPTVGITAPRDVAIRVAIHPTADHEAIAVLLRMGFVAATAGVLTVNLVAKSTDR